MVNWNDPTTIYLSARAYVLVQHTVFGIYIWEMLNFLYFDWDLTVRRKNFTSASVLYLLARYTALAGFIVQARITNVLSPINCHDWAFAAIALPYISIALCTSLLSLRVYALSGQNKGVLLLLIVLYTGFCASLTYGIVNTQSDFIPALYSCGDLNLKDHRINIFIQFGIDLAFLCLMTIFLLRGHRGLSLWNFLLQQSVIYFVGVTLGYFLAAVFLFLPFNDVVSESTGITGFLINVICATRMQRDLLNFVESDQSSTPEAASTIGFAVNSTSRAGGADQTVNHTSFVVDVERAESQSTVAPGQEK